MSRVLLATTCWQPFHTLQALFPNVPPLGLQILKRVLEEGGHEAQIADVQHLRPLHPTFLDQIDRFRPDVLTLTNNCMANTPVILEVARRLKQRYPGLKLAAGGQIPTFRPELFVGGQAAPFEAVGLYEGERVIAPLVEALCGPGRGRPKGPTSPGSASAGSASPGSASPEPASPGPASAGSASAGSASAGSASAGSASAGSASPGPASRRPAGARPPAREAASEPGMKDALRLARPPAREAASEPGMKDALRLARPPAREAALSQVRGIAFATSDGRIIRTELPAPLERLDDSPLPAWEGSLKRAAFSSGLAAAVETARGCPYGCSFCSIGGFFGRRARHKSVDRIMEELHGLVRLGATEIYFTDDSFGTDREQARALFERILAEKLDLKFGIQVRADIVAANADLIALGARAGLIMAVVGFEGYTAGVAANVRKGSAPSVNREASAILRRHGVFVYGTHVFGGPGTRMTDNLATFLLGRRNSDLFRMTIYTPLPGSPLFSELDQAQRITSYAPGDYYYGSYVIRDEHNPRLVEAAYFGLQLLHYFLPDTLLKPLLAPDPVNRVFHRRAYRGATRFVLGNVLPARWASGLGAIAPDCKCL